MCVNVLIRANYASSVVCVVYNLNNGYMNVDVLIMLLAVPAAIVGYIVYEMCRYDKVNEGKYVTYLHIDSQTSHVEPTNTCEQPRLRDDSQPTIPLHK